MANELSQLHPLAGERRTRTRVGRGEGAGKGKTAGRGTKGQQSRSGYSRRAGFEGGQMPLQRRLPKVGFRNIFAKDFETINVGRLADLDAGTVVTAEFLHEQGLISRIGKHGVKLLGGGDIGVALTIELAKCTQSAVAKVEAAGGTIAKKVADSDDGA